MRSLYAFLSLYAKDQLRTTFVLTSSDRTCREQRELNSTQNSYHVNGNAFDAVVVPWNPTQQTKLGIIARQLGFRWGGDFDEYDPVHFDDGRRSRPGTCPRR